MAPNCAPGLHRHPPMLRACEGCGRRVCGTEDRLFTSSGAVPICVACWAKWRDSGYSRTVRS